MILRSCLSLPLLLQMLVPRMSYFPLVLGEVRAHFRDMSQTTQAAMHTHRTETVHPRVQAEAKRRRGALPLTVSFCAFVALCSPSDGR